jgi:hypothetical protein
MTLTRYRCVAADVLLRISEDVRDAVCILTTALAFLRDIHTKLKEIKALVSRKGVKRDKNLDCPNVRAAREILRLQLNYLQRQFVVEKVSCCERGQCLWKAVLTEWMLNGFSPKNVPGMVKLWESQYYGVEGARFQEYIAETDATEVREPEGVRGVLFS